MKTYVYKITRNDGLEYIGITIRLNKRFKDHSRTERFKIGIEKIDILATCETYEEAEILEEKYIKEYNTFYDGLNVSINGKGNHLSGNFTTRGYKYSTESKNKMSKNHWSKRGFMSWNKGKENAYSDETKAKWSLTRKGFAWCDRKISLEDAKIILDNYKNNSIEFDSSFIVKFVKKTQVSNIENIPFEELITPNGKKLNMKKLYGEYYAVIFNVTPAAIYRILEGKTILAENQNKRTK